MIKGIDISEYQGRVDFRKVKADGIDFVIIRYADGSYIDKYFSENMIQAQANKLHFGAYLYSRAVNEAQAREEAQRLIRACEPYKYDMPLYIDIEADNIARYADMISRVFLEECDKQGVKGGIYANTNYFKNYIKTSLYKDYPLWIADIDGRATPAYHPEWFGLWQYSWEGKVEGINGHVDLDRCYVEYWKEQKDETSNVEKIQKVCDELNVKAQRVLAGDYGTGADREKALGSYYPPVQWIINRILEGEKDDG